MTHHDRMLLVEAIKAFETWMIAILWAGRTGATDQSKLEAARNEMIDTALDLAEASEQHPLAGDGGRNA